MGRRDAETPRLCSCAVRECEAEQGREASEHDVVHSMHGTLNGVQLRLITSIKTERASGRTLTTLRVLDSPLPELQLGPFGSAHPFEWRA